MNGQWMSDKTMSVRIVDGENVEDIGCSAADGSPGTRSYAAGTDSDGCTDDESKP